MFNRGGFPGQRPMGHVPMNQPAMNLPAMNMSGMNMPRMNMSGMGMPSMNQPNMPSMSQPNMPSMNQPNMNLSGMNHPGMNRQHMGPPAMNLPNMGLSGMNQPNMNLNRMNHPGMNQGGGMGFLPEMKTPSFGMRPMDNAGSFGGNPDPIGMKPLPVRPPMHSSSDRHMGPPVRPQQFPSPSFQNQGPPRMPNQNQEIPSIVNRVLTHSSDRMMGKPKAPLQEPPHLMEKKPWDNLNVFGNVAPDMGMKPIPSSSPINPVPGTQNRYTNESASSILESFGLSNEDLEELSRYPDDQLTPSNMPSILRDIRLRKMNRPAPVPDQSAGRRSGGDAVPSKVIDYGHSSKYQFNDAAPPALSYDPPRPEQKRPPLPKETAPPGKPKPSPQKGMDNKILTISGSRKPNWSSSSKLDRSNNKTLVGEDKPAPMEVSVTVPKVDPPVISIQADAAPEVAAPIPAELKATVVTGVTQVSYQKPAEPPAPGKGSWGASQEDPQKKKRLPTPSMMNDYYATSPRIFPHICSLCNVECRHLKDWIKHQNNASHIESCRNLRQQFPDWNPQQVLSSVNKKDEPTSKNSKSKSTSPRRARRSGSRHRGRKSRSRSPRSSGRRSRSRSPRRPRYSPKRSRSPRRVARSPLRSRSPRRHRRASHSNSPDKKAVDAAVQSFIESTKQKSGEKTKPARPTSNGKKPPPKPSNASVKGKKPASTGTAPKKPGSTSASKPGSTSSSSSSSKKPSNNNDADKKPSSSSSATRKPTSTSSATKKPTSASSSSKKPVVSTGAKKTSASTSSAKKAPPAKQSGSSHKAPDSPTITAKESSSFLKKMIHVTNLPDSGYTDQDILKVVRPFGKVSDIILIRSKNEAFIETNFVEAAAAAVKFSESTSVMINNQRIKMSLASSSKVRAQKARKGSEDGGKTKEEAAKAPAQTAAPKDAVKKVKGAAEKEDRDKKPKHDIEIVPGFVKCYKLDDPPLKENEKCVILISNLPEAQYTVDEISNLAKPFGGVNDILIVANHRKAYLELTSKNSVDSMIKFYNVFPTYLSGNLLSICVAHRYKDLKNEDLIFADLIEQASYKITPTIYEKFVYLTNLPDKEVEEFEILRVGLRFGKVEHYVLLSNKKKAILHLHNASAAKAMHSFLSQYPCNIGENIVQCSLPSKTKLAEDEYITYVEVEKQSSESEVENIASDKDQEKLSEPEDAEAKVGAGPSSLDGQSEMDVETGKGELASTKEDGKPGATSAPAKPPGSKSLSSCYVATEDDSDDEEAAEAPEAPETSPLDLQTEPEARRHETHAVSHPQVSEELEILVSVESDEEECVEQQHVGFGTERGPQRVTEKAELLNTETSAEEGTSDGPEKEGKEATEDGKSIAEPKTKEEMDNSDPNKGQDPSTDTSKLEESKEPSTISEGKAELSSTRREESKLKTSHEGAAEEKPNEEVSKSSEEKPGHPVPKKGKDVTEQPETGKAAVTMIRTTKYNAQKGEISVTVTMDSQKSTAKTMDSRKRTSREKVPSSHESSTPRSNSNRSSPADSASSHSKSGSSFPQKKISGKYVSSQPERDTKDTSRPRDREARSSSRKDDRTRGSSSSRYPRSSKSSNRSPRAKEEQEEIFPFNLDEFVTVDEIVEEQVDSKNKAKEQGEKADAARKGKRKEVEPVPSDTKKPRVASTESHEPSFVTLDEVGDEEENAGSQEKVAEQTAPSLVMLDEVKAEDGPPASAKEEQMLMTLDEISDEDDAHDSSTGRRSTTEPEVLAKDQLLTLDEVNEEDEEHATPTEPSSMVESKLPEDAQVTEVKEEDSMKEPEAKPEAEVQQEAPANAGQKEPSEQPLLTLDEVRADEEEMTFADIEHSFLTVDEVGEEEEETEGQREEKPKVESTSSKEKDSSKASDTATPAKRGRPRKRPLQSAEDIKDSSQPPPAPDTGKEAAPKPAPATAKPSKGSEQAAADSKRDSTSAPSDKPEAVPADVKPAPETPAKKTKLEPPPAEKTKLAPFNPSTPVGLEFLVPKTGYFCELCSLFYMDDSSKLKHCRSLRHYQAVEKQLAKSDASPEGRSAST